MKKDNESKEKTKKREQKHSNDINKNTKKVKGTKGKKGKKKHTAIKVLLVILLIIVILAGIFASVVAKNGGGLRGLVTTVVGSNPEKVKNLDDLYVLCIGKSQNMTDTIMVVKYSPKNQKATLLSVPRDSFVGKNKNTATAFDKINAKYQISPQSTINAVNDLTGLNLKYYVTVDTKALRDLVDAIGGVYFDVPINMDYDDVTQDLAIHLKKGYQLLNGEQAEGVVRFRHNNNGTSYSTDYGDNDLGRMKTQRNFISAVINQTMKPSNITKINALTKIATEEVETNMSWDLIKDYIAALMNFNTENLQADALPGTPQYMNGLSFFLVDSVGAKQKVKELFMLDSTYVDTESGNTTTSKTTKTSSVSKNSNSKINLQVLNGTGNTTKFNNAITQLKNQGYKVTKKGTTNVTDKTLIINRNNVSSDSISEIKTLLCTGVDKTGENNAGCDITIIIGMDY